jgi:predicted nucleic acid-binding protein
MSILDGQIASIALSQKTALATRNTKDFEHCNIEIINPFKKD